MVLTEGYLTRLYKSLYINEKGINVRKGSRSKKLSLKNETSSESSYDLKSDSVDNSMSEYQFEVFTSLNDKIRTPKKKKINKCVNTSSLKHEHNNFYATITIKCKECDEQFTRDFEF
ncbi:trophozoite stage antigen, putative [Plasmodium gallinaceum]|uniref:Trophozoite stage antigen, putative n=1 Tax=Plasmodium gallinaceum TaxID=5849 RepID=A0A1J1GSI5_PLAGA|nr:trophozoite stage antigen, putative [Plasmodium gallinaceum]CRG94272.1 trophozoite stage antigen, putative [Plasmodium gallinaceum]